MTITYLIITAILSLCGYSEDNHRGYIYAALVGVLFLYGEVIFDSIIPLLLAAFLLFIYIFGMVLENPNGRSRDQRSL